MVISQIQTKFKVLGKSHFTETVIMFCIKMWYIAEKGIKEGGFLKAFKLQISKKK